MADLFTNAARVLSQIDTKSSPKRIKSIDELMRLLMRSPFLSKGEKEKMAKVIPFFTNDIIEDLKQTLMRHNLRALKTKFI